MPQHALPIEIEEPMMHSCLRPAVLLTLALLTVPALAQQTASPAASATTPAASGPKHAEFVKVFDQWKGLLQKLRDLREQYKESKPAQQDQIAQQYQALLAQGEAMQSQVLEAAVAAFREAPTGDKELLQFLVSVIYTQTKADQYEDVLRLAEPLIEQGVPEKQEELKPLYSWAGDAAFAVGQWDLAEQYLKKAVELGTTGKNDAHYLASIPYYREVWPKEQKIRDAEAKADDLPRVLLKTNKGEIVVELFENEAPNTVANFISLVEKGFYDGLTFHRVLEVFVAQGGCPRGDGTGNPGYSIPCECYQPNHRLHFRGSLSMAHAGRDSGGSQFFLTFIPTQGLDGKHTVFGRVIEGTDVLGKLQRRDPDDPDALEPDKILEAKVLRKRNHPYEPKTLPLKQRMRPGGR
jgi:cyclophilin family peptidyl-prolyl cis-trans isomerase